MDHESCASSAWEILNNVDVKTNMKFKEKCFYNVQHKYIKILHRVKSSFWGNNNF